MYMYKKIIFLIIPLFLTANTTNAESMSKKTKNNFSIEGETLIEVKTVLRKEMPGFIERITSSGVDLSSGAKMFGIKQKNGKFAVMNNKRDIIFEKVCQQGKVSKDGRKVFLWEKSDKPDKEYKLVKYDLKGNKQWELDSSLPIHLSENEKFVAEFKTWEGESNPHFILRNINSHKIIWQKNDFPFRWRGYLLENGKLIVIQHEKKIDKFILSLYGLNGEQLWQYTFPKASSFPLVVLGEKCFIIASSTLRGDLPPIGSVYAFNGEKGLLWHKEDFHIGVGIHGLSSNDKYYAIYKAALKELSLFEMGSGKEIYKTALTQSMRERRLYVASDGKVAINHSGGTIIFNKKGKVIMQRKGSQVKFTGNDILLFNNSSFEAIEIKEKE